MVQGVDALRGRPGETSDRVVRDGIAEAHDVAPFGPRNRITESPVREPEAELVRRLAADHLRELRDDGVTLDYVARMYEVSPERLEVLYDDLVPSPPR